MEQYTRRVLAEINLDNIIFNYRQAVACTGSRPVYCVIKANAYGHGAVPVALALAKAGASHFAVAAPEEALQLRRHGIKQPLLLLGLAEASWAKPLAQQDVALAVDSLATAHAYAAAAGQKIKVHIKLNTGMERIGMPWQAAAQEILAIAALPGITVEGLFTHFAAADDVAENEFTNTQMRRFEEVYEELRRSGLTIALPHCANSAATINHPHTHAAMARPGIMLYGSNPLPGNTLELRPTMALRARVAQVIALKAGESVGYGRAWYAPRDSVIATLTVGYADGFMRLLSGRLPLLLRGRKAPLVGRICMDMCMLDVTDIPGVSVGDYATIIGTDGEASISADEIAEIAHTIPHEIFCAVGLRVPRYYFQGGRLLSEHSYLEKI